MRHSRNLAPFSKSLAQPQPFREHARVPAAYSDSNHTASGSETVSLAPSPGRSQILSREIKSGSGLGTRLTVSYASFRNCLCQLGACIRISAVVSTAR